MKQCKYGNPKKRSQFICIKCGRIDGVMPGIQRMKQREKGHVKDLYCIYCKETVKTLEVRYNDYLPDMQEQARKIRSKYYKEELQLCVS